MRLKSTLESTLTDIKKEKKPVFFLSPHLDDAVLSCGELISELAKTTDVTVITLFTKAHSSPQTLSARRFLMHCHEQDAQILFEKRRKEDEKAVSLLGAIHLHMNKVDGTWRMFEWPSLWRKVLGRYLPEFLHLYPTYLHVKTGRLVKEDKKNLNSVFGEIRKIIPSEAVIFAPLGVGNHVDHVFTREVASRFLDVIYWSDFPYNQKSTLSSHFITHLKLENFEYSEKNSLKEEAIKKYSTQLPSLFPTGDIPQANEIYFIKEN